MKHPFETISDIAASCRHDIPKTASCTCITDRINGLFGLSFWLLRKEKNQEHFLKHSKTRKQYNYLFIVAQYLFIVAKAYTRNTDPQQVTLSSALFDHTAHGCGVKNTLFPLILVLPAWEVLKLKAAAQLPVSFLQSIPQASTLELLEGEGSDHSF